MLVQGTVLPSVTRAPTHIQGPTFPPAPVCQCYTGCGRGASVYSGGGHTANGRCGDAQSGHAISWCIHGSSNLAHMPSFLPCTKVPSTTLSEHELLALQSQELEARELEVERRTQALKLNIGRDDAERSSWILPSQEQAPIKAKCASSQSATYRSFSLKRDCPSSIHVTSTVTIKTVKPLPASPKREVDRPGQAQDLASLRNDIKATMQDMIKSSLTEFGVIPKANPPQ